MKGVYQCKRTGHYQVSIYRLGRLMYLGTFKTYEEAVKARLKAEELFPTAKEFWSQYKQTAKSGTVQLELMDLSEAKRTIKE